MKISEITHKGKPKQIKRGNGGKTTIKYVDDVPDINNPVSKAVLTLPHLRSRTIPSKKPYSRKNKEFE